MSKIPLILRDIPGRLYRVEYDTDLSDEEAFADLKQQVKQLFPDSKKFDMKLVRVGDTSDAKQDGDDFESSSSSSSSSSSLKWPFEGNDRRRRSDGSV